MEAVYLITAENLAKFQHQMIVGLDHLANAMTLLADDIDSGVIQEHCAGSAVRDFAKMMSKMVAEISD